MSASVNIQDFLNGLRQGGEAQLAAAKQRLEQFAAHVIGDSQQRTPVATGFLQSSGTQLPLVDDGRNIFVPIGHNASYAAAVHERIEIHHEIGEAKFLTNAMSDNAPKMMEFVAAGMRGATNG